MTRIGFYGRMAILAVLLAAGGSQPAAAQGRVPQILTLGGGMSSYQFTGETMKNTFVFHIRFDGYIGPYVIFEPGAAYIRIRTSLGSRNYLLPELSLQAQGYLGEKVRPFIGAGLGFANIATGANENQFTVHAVTGVRIHLSGPWGVRFEVRGRSIDPWKGHTLDFTVGIMRIVPTGI